MIRQRALAWAAVLALVVSVQGGSLPARFSASAALAQDDAATTTGEPAELAIAALHCAEAPGAEALTTYITDATLPARCAPAVGVTVTVTENGEPVSGNPFTTGVDGTAAVPVRLGSAIEIREDPASLPAGYEPLTDEANGVPYANPVRLDPAVAGAAVLFVNVPGSVATELAQSTSDEAGAPTELAVVALQCADAPAMEALTSYFTSGSPPGGCAPAEGVTITVTENEQPLSGSPFQTDANGSLAVRIGLGSDVTVKEDPKSLPSGYVPLTQEFNGVPYANPVRLDSAVAGAAVLFVNVPTAVAARLAEGGAAVDAGEVTNLSHAATPGRTGCDPAYPDERTCIAPGRPLAEPCAITDQRNFTVLAPDPRGLDADGDGIGCEPISPAGGTLLRGASVNLYTSRGDLGHAAPIRTADVAVSADPVRSSDGGRVSPPVDSRAINWVAESGRNRAGLWFQSRDRSRAGNLAVVSNPIVIGHGLWRWPNRHDENDWFRRGRNHDGILFWPGRISVGNIVVSGSGSGNVAIASNPVFISNGVGVGPNRNHDDDLAWRHRFGIGSWHWLNRISAGNITVAGSGDGNVAIASNPVFIGNGLWRRPVDSRHDGRFGPGHDPDDNWFWRSRFGNGVWGWPDRIAAGNLAVARSDDGNLAVASNPIFIRNGAWSWPTHFDNDDWFQPNLISVGNITVAGNGNGNVAIASNPVFISHGVWAEPNRLGNDDWFWRNRNHDDRLRAGGDLEDWRGRNRFGKGIWGWPSTIFVGNLTVAGSGDGSVAIASNPVFISRGVWYWPGHSGNRFWLWPNRDKNVLGHWPNRFGKGIWGWPSTIFVGNLTVARSSSGNVAIVSNPIVISSGVWFVAPDRNHHDHWLVRGDRDDTREEVRQDGAGDSERSDGQSTAIDSRGSSETPPSKIETLGAGEQPALTVNGAPAVEPPADSSQPASDGSVEPAAGVTEPSTGGTVAPESVGYVAAPSEAAAAPASDVPAEPAADTGAVEPAYVAPDPNSVDPSYGDAGNVDPGYVAADPVVDPGYVAPDTGADSSYVAPDSGADPGYVDPGYVAPEPSYVDGGGDPGMAAPEPSYVDPGAVDPGYVDPGYVAPDPVVEPSYSAPQPSYDDPGIDPGYIAPEPSYSAPEPNNIAPEPSYSVPEPSYSAPEPSYVDAGNGAPNPGMGAAGGPDPSTFAPEPSFTDTGGEAGYVDGGDAGGGNISPDPGVDAGGTVDAGNGAPESGDGRGKRGKRNNRD